MILQILMPLGQMKTWCMLLQKTRKFTKPFRKWKKALQNKKRNGKSRKRPDFMEAARLRDEMFRMQKELEAMKK